MTGTVEQWAQKQGITRQAANKRIREHRIPRLADGRIDFEVADRIWSQVRNAEQQARSTGAAQQQAQQQQPPGMGLAAAQLRLTLVRLEKEAIKVAAMKNTLVDRKAVEDAAFARGKAEKDAWMAWTREASEKIAEEFELEPQKVHLCLHQLVNQHLIGRSKEIPFVVNGTASN